MPVVDATDCGFKGLFSVHINDIIFSRDNHNIIICKVWNAFTSAISWSLIFIIFIFIVNWISFVLFNNSLFFNFYLTFLS